MERTPYQPTEEDRKTVKKLASLGMRQEDIATIIRVSSKGLRKHFRLELDCSAIEANASVGEALLEMAASGKNPAASIFWAKVRCGWHERPAKRESAKELPPFNLIYTRKEE